MSETYVEIPLEETVLEEISSYKENCRSYNDSLNELIDKSFKNTDKLKDKLVLKLLELI